MMTSPTSFVDDWPTQPAAESDESTGASLFLARQVAATLAATPPDALATGMEHAARDVCRALGADAAYLASLDDSGETLETTFLCSHDGPVERRVTRVEAASSWAWCEHLRAGEAVSIVGLEEATRATERKPDPLIEELGFHAALLVPIRGTEQSTGVFGVLARAHPRRWNEEESALLSLVAALFAQALERRSSLTVFQAILDGTSPSERSDLSRSVVRQLATTLRASAAVVAELDGRGHLHTLAVWHRGEFAANLSMPLTDSVAAVMVERGIVHYPKAARTAFPSDPMLAQLRGACVMGQSLRDAAGDPIGVLAVLNDGPLADPTLARRLLPIFAARAAAHLDGERKNDASDAARLATERRFALLAEHASDVIWTADSDLELLYTSPAIERLLGYPPEEGAGMPLASLLTGDAMRQAMSALARVQKMPAAEAEIYLEGRRFELAMLRRDGSVVWTETRVAPIPDGSPDGAAYIGITRDISERRKNEESAQRQREQFLENQRLATLGALADALAHEINNPASVALLNARLLDKLLGELWPTIERIEDEVGDGAVAGMPLAEARDQLRDGSGQIVDATQRVQRIIDGLRRLTAADSQARKAPIPLNDLLVSAVEVTDGLLRRATQRLAVDFEPELPAIIGNPEQLRLVLVNLISNACEALDDPSQCIELATHYDGTAVLVTVRDEGRGMPEEAQRRALDALVPTSETSAPAGLGLYLVYNIVAKHGGEVTVQSSSGHGTTVKLRFPVASG